VVQDLAIELAVTGVSYRQASNAMEKLLGYPVISHEGIRQQLLNTEVVPEESVPLHQDVVFVEVDGLYTKSQETGKKGRERSEEHTSELQSRFDLVCRLLLEKK